MQESLFDTEEKTPKKRGAKQKPKAMAKEVVVSFSAEDASLARRTSMGLVADDLVGAQTPLPSLRTDLNSMYFKHRSLVEATGQIHIVAHRVMNAFLWYASQMTAMGLVVPGETCVIEMDTIIDKVGRERVRSRSELWKVIVEVLKITIVFREKGKLSNPDGLGNNFAFPVFSGLNFDSDEGVIRYQMSPFFSEVIKSGPRGLFDIDATRCLKTSVANRLYELAALEITCSGHDEGSVSRSMSFEELRTYGLYEDWEGTGGQFLSKVIVPTAKIISEESNIRIKASPVFASKKIVGVEFEFALKDEFVTAVMTADVEKREKLDLALEMRAFGFSEKEADDVVASRDPLDIRFALDETARRIKDKAINKTPYRYLRSFLFTGTILSDAEKVAIKKQKSEAARSAAMAKKLEALFAAKEEGLMKEFSSRKNKLDDHWLSLTVEQREDFYSRAIEKLSLPWMHKMKTDLCSKSTPPDIGALKGLLIDQLSKDVP